MNRRRERARLASEARIDRIWGSAICRWIADGDEDSAFIALYAWLNASASLRAEKSA